MHIRYVGKWREIENKIDANGWLYILIMTPA
jgi:hypothetical protein